MLRIDPRRWGLGVVVAALAVVMIGPLVVVIVASLTTTSYVTFPPHGFSLEWYRRALSEPDISGSLSFSVWLALASASISTILATAGALGVSSLMAKRPDRLRERRGLSGSFVRALLLLPMMFPAVVIAVALLVFFTKLGFVSPSNGLLASHVIHTFPFAFIMVEVGLANAPATLSRAAEALGAGPLRRFLYITLPLASGGIAAAFALACILSFGEVTIAIFLQGPDAVTLPVLLYNRIYAEPPTPDLTAVSGLITVATVCVMLFALWAVSRVARRLVSR